MGQWEKCNAKESSSVDLPTEEYSFVFVKTVALKMDSKQIALLKERAKLLGCSKGAVVRDLIDRHLAPKKRLSLYQRAKDLCGSVSGPNDLSTRSLKV
jgi:hypothetical protein